ncbi:hypothetical protein P7K49_005956 [Saguinus oedipus]|uniref:Uncharacterized protein n=1 Tax=Saguinus oedipus TaxID=9490 RepID=A0ABQ9W1K2_SAGOE|nr:hypothetical protein P7K49_005956 [Saguinus oedipus]
MRDSRATARTCSSERVGHAQEGSHAFCLQLRLTHGRFMEAASRSLDRQGGGALWVEDFGGRGVTGAARTLRSPQGPQNCGSRRAFIFPGKAFGSPGETETQGGQPLSAGTLGP